MVGTENDELTAKVSGAFVIDVSHVEERRITIKATDDVESGGITARNLLLLEKVVKDSDALVGKAIPILSLGRTMVNIAGHVAKDDLILLFTVSKREVGHGKHLGEVGLPRVGEAIEETATGLARAETMLGLRAMHSSRRLASAVRTTPMRSRATRSSEIARRK